MRRLAIAALVLAASCGSSEKDTPAPARGAIARFDLAATGALRWGAVPFPSDLYLGGDGTIDLATPPPGLEDEPVWQAIVEHLHQRKGFCTTCNAYFGVDGVLDKAKLPKNAGPESVASANDAVVMIDADPASPEHGKLLAVQLEWNADDKLLAVRPVPWIILRKSRKYVVAITTKLRDAEGLPMRAAATFLAARDGGGDASAQRARAIVSPALDALTKAGVPRAEVIAVAAFTTGDPTADVATARKLVHAAPKPVATFSKIWPSATETLDDVFGVPADATPGAHTAAKDLSLGKYAVVHDEIAHLVYGSYASPHVRKGASTEGGVPIRTTSGELGAEGDEKVPFLLAIPKTAKLDKLPVAIVMVGAGSSGTLALGVANTFARAGVATLAIDGPCKGGRAKGAVDKVTEMRGNHPIPDGIPDADNTEGDLRGWGLVGPAAGQKANPAYLLGFSLQAETDLMAAVRFAKEGDLAALRKDALATLAFDPANVFMLGNHHSTVFVGTLMAVETDLAGVMLNAVIPSFGEAMMEGPGGQFISANFSVPLALRLDLDGVTRRYAFHPGFDMFRWVLEPSDARALAPYVYVDPITTGPRPDLLIQRPALDEFVHEEHVASAAYALGIPSLVAMPEAPVGTKPAPLSANVTTKAGNVTAGVSIFADGLARLMWFGEETSSFDLPFTPPLKPKAKPMVLKNPIVGAHAQLEAFVRARVEKGRAEIVAPPK